MKLKNISLYEETPETARSILVLISGLPINLKNFKLENLGKKNLKFEKKKPDI